MVALPNFALVFADPNCDARSPKTHPPFQRRRVNSIWRAEEMQVIGHNNISAYQPG